MRIERLRITKFCPKCGRDVDIRLWNRRNFKKAKNCQRHYIQIRDLDRASIWTQMRLNQPYTDAHKKWNDS